MNVQIENDINTLIWRGADLLRNYQADLNNLDSPAAVVAKGFITESLGALVTDVTGSRRARSYSNKVTNAVFKNAKRQQIEAMTQKYYLLYVGWMQDVVNFLFQVSTNSTRIVAPGNSRTLVKRVKKAEQYKKLDTRIRHATTQLELMRADGLIQNNALPKHLSEPKRTLPQPNANAMLKEVESSLRRFIEQKLSAQRTDWWTSYVPANIRNRVENRMHRSEVVWPWHSLTSSNLVDYLDFSDYRKIILETNNWDHVFKHVFASKAFIETRLTEIEPIRNDIAHSRSISKTSQDKLRIYSEELNICMRR